MKTLFILQIGRGLFISSPSTKKITWATNKNVAYKFTNYEKEDFIDYLISQGIFNIKEIAFS